MVKLEVLNDSVKKPVIPQELTELLKGKRRLTKAEIEILEKNLNLL